MSPREFGRSIGYQQGQTIQGAELAEFQKLYNDYRRKAVLDWEVKSSGGKMVRVNPTTGMVMEATNAAGEPQPMGASDTFADYAGPAAGGVAGAAVDTNSMAFQGVQPAAAPQANPVVPVNVNPAAPAAAPTATPAPSPAFRTEDEVIAAARAGRLSKAQAQAILVNQFGLDP